MTGEPSAAVERFPLLAFGGERPRAPEWLRRALADAPVSSFVEVLGTRIEMRCWGKRGDPGVLLAHGSRAHASWWDFIAPFLSKGHRVVAYSQGGMGRSGRRTQYSLELFAEELKAVARAADLFDSSVKPMMFAHSFGGIPALKVAAAEGERWAGLSLVDTLITTEQVSADDAEVVNGSKQRIYRSEAAALARFRLIPEQNGADPAVIDYVARAGLRQGEDASGTFWTWRFDPEMWGQLVGMSILSATLVPLRKCPLNLIWGEKSPYYMADHVAWLKTELVPDAACYPISSAGHHVLLDRPLKLVEVMRTILEKNTVGADVE